MDRRRRRHLFKPNQPARAAACFREPPAAEWSGPPRPPGPARPRRHLDDADLHARARPADQGDGEGSSPARRREARVTVDPWRVTPDGILIAFRPTPKGGGDAIEGVVTARAASSLACEGRPRTGGR